MVSQWIFPAVVGIVLGCLSGLGVGGGSLLMLWLTLVMGTDQEQARLMNLMFFIPCALTVSIFRWRQGKLDWKLTASAVAAGCLGAALGNVWRQHVDMDWMKRIFGILFILCGIRELFYRPRKAR